jgi:hypothetical protein
MKVYSKSALPIISKPLCKVIPVREMIDILQIPGPPDHQDRESLRVFKFGRTSGFTAGSLNEIRSDCCFEEETTEYCIVNVPSLNNFSYEGDSGACIFDFEGRIVGMIHSGNGKGQLFGAELTYVTPMQWILDDIKETLKTDDVVIEQN